MWTAFMSVLGAILPGIFGQAINGVVAVEQAKITAATDQSRLDEDLSIHQVAAETAAASTNAQVVIAEQSHWFTRAVRPMLAIPFIVYVWQLVADKTVLTWFGIQHSTDDLGPTLHWIALMVLTSYLGPATYSAFRRG